MIQLKVEDLGFSIDRIKIIDAISLEVQKNEFVGLVGP